MVHLRSCGIEINEMEKEERFSAYTGKISLPIHIRSGRCRESKRNELDCVDCIQTNPAHMKLPARMTCGGQAPGPVRTRRETAATSTEQRCHTQALSGDELRMTQ